MKDQLEVQRKLQKFSYKMFNVVVHHNDNNKDGLKYNIQKNPFIIIKNVNNFNQKSLSIALDVIQEFFITQDEMNKTFYKRWTSVTDKSRYELLIDQMLHYISTYGLNLEEAYYPEDLIDLSNITKSSKNKFKVIESISFEEFIEKLKSLLKQNIALKGDEVKDILYLVSKYDIAIDPMDIGNREFRMIYMKRINVIPKDPEEFLRLLIYISTNGTLLIKSKDVQKAIISSLTTKEIENTICEYFKKYIQEYDIKDLASIFNRFKPLFLSFKTEKTKSIINKISKLSKKYHHPKDTPDYLKVAVLSYNKFKNLSTLDTSYLVKIYNSINFLIHSIENNNNIRIYRVRNGKYYIKEFDKNTYRLSDLKRKKEDVVDWITSRLFNNMVKYNLPIINFKSFIINYAVPTTGKQFIGDIPYGSSINTKNNSVFGIYWKNVGSTQIDLDLSVTNQKHKLGWNSDFYNENSIFSGDITDAPNGASECILIKDKDPLYKLNVNYYNCSPSMPKVPFKFYIATGIKDKDIKNNYMAPEDKIIYQTNIDSYNNTPSLSLGVILNKQFIFDNFSIPKNVEGITPKSYFSAIKIEAESKLKFLDLNIDWEMIKSILGKEYSEYMPKNVLLQYVK